MRNFVILIGMLLCLFAPTAFFAYIGYHAITKFGQRPSGGAKLMIALITKLVLASGAIMGVLMIILKVYGGKK